MVKGVLNDPLQDSHPALLQAPQDILNQDPVPCGSNYDAPAICASRAASENGRAHEALPDALLPE